MAKKKDAPAQEAEAVESIDAASQEAEAVESEKADVPKLLTLEEALAIQRKFWAESDAEAAEASPKRVRKVRRM